MDEERSKLDAIDRKEKEFGEQIYEFCRLFVAASSRVVSNLRLYQIRMEDEMNNNDGGCMSICCNRNIMQADLFVYRSIYDEIPDGGMTNGFLIFLMSILGHEIGHFVIDDLEGTKRDIERGATEVGLILMKSIENDVLSEWEEEVKKNGSKSNRHGGKKTGGTRK